VPRKPTPTPVGLGHNSVGPVDRDRLGSLVERIENIEQERASLAEDVRSIYSEAKGQGYDVAALRQIIKLRRQDQDKRAALQSTIDEYWSALGDYGTTPLGKAALERAGLVPPV
jgi:uncharacterized protein (UPF0335 family)